MSSSLALRALRFCGVREFSERAQARWHTCNPQTGRISSSVSSVLWPMSQAPLLFPALKLFSLVLVLTSAALTHASEPTADLEKWQVEQMPGGTVTTNSDALVIDDAAGCTVWWKQSVTAPVEITYDVTVISRGGPHDRVSDVNCFWMARDPKATDGCPFSAKPARTGRFSDYDSLLTYYVGMGGNENTTTRFRRYDGTTARPLLPEHDLQNADVLLAPNQTYHIRLVARNGVAEFWRDDKRLFSFKDAQPLRSGWFGLRTVKSHLEIRHFKVKTDSADRASDGAH